MISERSPETRLICNSNSISFSSCATLPSVEALEFSITVFLPLSLNILGMCLPQINLWKHFPPLLSSRGKIDSSSELCNALRKPQSARKARGAQAAFRSRSRWNERQNSTWRQLSPNISCQIDNWSKNCSMSHSRAIRKVITPASDELCSQDRTF